ncbi:MAG: hypothetical protein FVQ80_15335 [Planctomycetes bacterium]|nr:hypothetical protein [Planctomycetota bacterium]
MSIDGLFTVLAITIALFALTQPIQRKTIIIFVPIWLLLAIFLVPTCVLIWREIVSVLGYEYYLWSDLVSRLIAILLPIIGLSISIYLWNRAKLGRNKDLKFRDFIHTSINEDKYGELARIIRKNQYLSSKQIVSDTLDFLFDQKVVESLNRFPTWLHLRLLANESLFNISKNPCSIVNVVMRTLISKKASILQSYMASRFGGLEYSKLTELEQDLIEKIFEDPHYYIDFRIDYPLLIYASERIDSGELDIKYNKNDDLYIKMQGQSGRINCPIFLFIKIHYLALENAIEIDDKDFYVSDLWDIFRKVCDHIMYDRFVWENPKANSEFPTPYIYLVKEILKDLRILTEKKLNKGTNTPGRLGEDIVRIWYTCISYISRLEKIIPISFITNCTTDYYDLLLEIRGHYNKDETNKKGSTFSDWSDLMLDEIKYLSNHNNKIKEIMRLSINQLDKGKHHVFKNVKWLSQELGL